jgi:hypothetical protein
VEGDYTYWVVAAGDEVEVAVDEEHGHGRGDGSFIHPSGSLGAGLTGSAGLGSLDSISICQDSPGAEGPVSLLFHAFYVSALVGLVFPLTALDIRLRDSYCQKHPTYNPTILKQPGRAFPSPHLTFGSVRKRDRVSFSSSGWKCALHTTGITSKNLPN